jgi:hypothetical protein
MRIVRIRAWAYFACLTTLVFIVSVGWGRQATNSIRNIDFKQYLLSRNGLGRNLKKEFGDVDPIHDIQVQYAKLIKAGDDEEAVVAATTCAMGNGGADIVEVFRMKADGQLISLEIDDSGYKRGSLYEGQTATPRLEVKSGKLTRWFVMYAKGSTVGNPKAGLKRVIVYRWSSNRFKIDTVKDVKEDAR